MQIGKKATIAKNAIVQTERKKKIISVIVNIAIPAISILFVLSGVYSFIFFNEMLLLKKEQSRIANINYQQAHKIAQYEIHKKIINAARLDAKNKELQQQIEDLEKALKIQKRRASKPIPEVKDDGKFSRTLYDFERLDKKGNGLEGL